MRIQEFDVLPEDEQKELMDECKLSKPLLVLSFHELKHRIGFVDLDLFQKLTPTLFLNLKEIDDWGFYHIHKLAFGRPINKTRSLLHAIGFLLDMSIANYDCFFTLCTSQVGRRTALSRLPNELFYKVIELFLTK